MNNTINNNKVFHKSSQLSISFVNKLRAIDTLFVKKLMKAGDKVNLLSDELLIEAYLAAVEYKLDCEFISLLFSEIRTRRIPL